MIDFASGITEKGSAIVGKGDVSPFQRSYPSRWPSSSKSSGYRAAGAIPTRA